MRLTTKGRFAVTAMIDLGSAPEQWTGDAGCDQPAPADFAVVPGAVVRQVAPPRTGRVDPWPGRRLHAGAQGVGHHGGRHHRVGRRADRRHPVRRQGKLPGRGRALHDPRPVGFAERAHGRVSRLGDAAEAGRRAARQGPADRGQAARQARDLRDAGAASRSASTRRIRCLHWAARWPSPDIPGAPVASAGRVDPIVRF